MSSIRLKVTVELDGELHLRGLPLRKGDEAEVIVVTAPLSDDALLALLENDPAWAWLRAPGEDLGGRR